MQAEKVISTMSAPMASALPVDLLVLAQSFPFPFTSTSTRDAQDMLRMRLAEFLPSLPDAWKMVETYYANSAWLFNPLPKEDFMSSMFAPLYGDEGTTALVMAVEPHALAVVFSE